MPVTPPLPHEPLPFVRDALGSGSPESLSFLGHKISGPMTFEPVKVLRGSDRFARAARGVAAAASSAAGTEATGVGAAVNQATGLDSHNPVDHLGPNVTPGGMPDLPDGVDAEMVKRFQRCLPTAVGFFEAMMQTAEDEL